MLVSDLVLGRFDHRRVLGFLLFVPLFLAFMHVVSVWSGREVMISYWGLGHESNVPTWWSSIQLLGVGILVWLLARLFPSGGRERRVLLVGAAGLVFFSLDETATIHESVTGVLERFEAVPRLAGSHGVWIFVYAAIGLGLLVWAFPALKSLYQRFPNESRWFVVGMGVFVLGGVVFEAIGYYSGPMVVIEESLEMIGAAIMLWAAYRALDAIRVIWETDGRYETASSNVRS